MVVESFFYPPGARTILLCLFVGYLLFALVYQFLLRSPINALLTIILLFVECLIYSVLTVTHQQQESSNGVVAIQPNVATASDTSCVTHHTTCPLHIVYYHQVGVGKERRTLIGPWRDLQKQHPFLLELP